MAVVVRGYGQINFGKREPQRCLPAIPVPHPRGNPHFTGSEGLLACGNASERLGSRPAVKKDMHIVSLERLWFGAITASRGCAAPDASDQQFVRATADKPFKLTLDFGGHSVTPQIPAGKNVAIRR